MKSEQISICSTTEISRNVFVAERVEAILNEWNARVFAKNEKWICCRNFKWFEPLYLFYCTTQFLASYSKGMACNKKSLQCFHIWCEEEDILIDNTTIFQLSNPDFGICLCCFFANVICIHQIFCDIIGAEIFAREILE